MDDPRAARHQRAGDQGRAAKHSPAEAKLVTAFCRYLVRGPPRYGQDRITVLATYVAQVGSLRRKLQSDGLGDVRVASVDNFQGEENDIILLSLVRNDGRPDGASAQLRAVAQARGSHVGERPAGGHARVDAAVGGQRAVSPRPGRPLVRWSRSVRARGWTAHTARRYGTHMGSRTVCARDRSMCSEGLN